MLPTLLTNTLLLSLTLVLTPTAAHPHPRPHAPVWRPGYSLGPAFAGAPHGIDEGNSICLGPCVKEVPKDGGLGCPREFKEEFVEEKQCHMCCIIQN